LSAQRTRAREHRPPRAATDNAHWRSRAQGGATDPSCAWSTHRLSIGVTIPLHERCTMKLLVPVDESQTALSAIDHAAWLGRECGGVEAVLVNVRNPAEFYGGIAVLERELVERSLREAQQRLLAAALDHAQGAGLTKVSVRAAQGVPAEEIVRAAEQCGADQIVMGTHGRSTMGVFFAGSVAQRVVHLAPMPVTLVRGAGADPAQRMPAE
jgi:nucleotide-binding universal stress UspA family protein